MKPTHLFLMATACFIVAACAGNSRNDQSTDLDTTSTDTTAPRLTDTVLCYLRMEGNLNQDSTYVYLKIEGDSVQGVYNWLPDGKDARRGVIYGTRKGDTVQVVWRFKQEGRDDTLRTAFLLQPDLLKQKPYTVDKETGRQVMDAHAAFSIEYKSTACPPLIAGIE